MGIISFIKTRFFSKAQSYEERDKRGSQQLLDKLPTMSKMVLINQRQLAAQTASNLRLLGRDSDAEGIILGHLQSCLEKIGVFPEDPSFWVILTQSVIYLNPKTLDLEGPLRNLIKSQLEKKNSTMDLTLIYFSLGLLCHYKYGTGKEQLLAYHNGGLFEVPKNCKCPSTVNEKARCHEMAFIASRVLRNKELDDLHTRHFSELVPEVNPHDMPEVLKWHRNI